MVGQGVGVGVAVGTCLAWFGRYWLRMVRHPSPPVHPLWSDLQTAQENITNTQREANGEEAKRTAVKILSFSII